MRVKKRKRKYLHKRCNYSFMKLWIPANYSSDKKSNHYFEINWIERFFTVKINFLNLFVRTENVFANFPFDWKFCFSAEISKFSTNWIIIFQSTKCTMGAILLPCYKCLDFFRYLSEVLHLLINLFLVDKLIKGKKNVHVSTKRRNEKNAIKFNFIIFRRLNEHFFPFSASHCY